MKLLNFGVLILVAVASLPLGAQSCRTPDAVSARFIEQLRSIATATDSAWAATRAKLGVPAVASAQITLENKDTVCKKAASAYDREVMRLQRTPSQPRRLHLVKVGNYYAALDPAYRAPESEYGTVIFLTSQFAFISSWTQ